MVLSLDFFFTIQSTLVNFNTSWYLHQTF